MGKTTDEKVEAAIKGWDSVAGDFRAKLRAALSAADAIAAGEPITAAEHRLKDLKQMAAYDGAIVSFECREPYYLASCDHCGWVGSSEICGTDSFGDDSDVYCPRCHASGADCGKIASRIATPRAPAEPDFSQSIADVIKEESANGAAAGWRSCTGCHETHEGYETGHFPYSKMFGCYVGSGCSECGGIGVTWEYWSETDLNVMGEDIPTPPAPKVTECATEGCEQPAGIHFIRGNVGSNYCIDCYKRVHRIHQAALSSAATPPASMFELNATNDQIAAVMLQHGTDEQRQEALAYAGVNTAPAVTGINSALMQIAAIAREARPAHHSAALDKIEQIARQSAQEVRRTATAAEVDPDGRFERAYAEVAGTVPPESGL